MKRKTISRMLALLLTACLCLSLGAAAFADEGDGLITDPDTGTVTNPAGNTYPSNEGSIDKNEGTIIVNTAPTDTNHEGGGSIGENIGTVGDVQNPTDANQGNAGTISENSGDVTLNSGVIGTNTETGSIETNTGTVGWMGVKETGEVWVEGGGNEGHIDTNSGTVVINTGDIDQNTASGTVGVLDQNNTPVEGTGNYGNIDNNEGTVTFNAGAGDLPESEPEVVIIGEDGGESGADPTESDYTGATIGTNEGTVLVNNGLIGTNSGVIDTNTGTVVDNLESGTVKENAAPTEDDEDGGNIGTNSGTVEENNGTVSTNENGGEIIENNGLVETNSSVIDTNTGTVVDNLESGTVKENAAPTEDDKDGGNIGTNSGTVEENKGTVETNTEKGIVENNSGTVGLVANEAGNPLEGTGNFGTIDTNSGTVVYNDGDATIGTNTETGTVHDNYGTVEENSGKVDYNRGTVEENSGTVSENGGTVGSVDETGKMKSGNTGTVSRNDESGVVLNLEDGIVKKSYGEVYNYGGEVNESFGTEYFSVEIVNTTTYTKDESSGLKEAYGQQWLGQTGRTQTTATVILTPAEGYKITLIAGLSDNVKAQRNDDGTWTLTIKSGSNITINVPEATEINAKPQPVPDPDPDPDPDPNPKPAPQPAPAPDPQPASDPQPGPSWQDHLFVITYGDGSQVAYNLNVDSISATATEPAPAAPITPPAKTERTVKGTVDHATHLEKVDDVVNQLEGNTLTALQNGNAVFSAAFDVQNADMLDSGIVDFGGAFEEAEEDVILVPSVSGQYFENNTYTVVYSDGTVVHAVCTNAGVLWIPFPHDAKGLAFVVLKGTVESSQLVKHTILAAETLDSGAGSVTLQFDANQVAGPIVDGIHNEVHVQNTGWTGRAQDGELAGTTGQSRRLEAVRVSLTGDALMDDYSVWYRVHSQTYGWLGWAHDGEPAGTAGLAKRAEAIDVQVLPQGQVPRGYDATQRAPAAQTGGTTEATSNANTAGTTGATSAAGGDAAHAGSFDDDDLAALNADALNSILENDQNARNAQRSAANANAAGTTEATTAAVNRGDVADNAQQTNNANALGVYSPTGDHSGALGD